MIPCNDEGWLEVLYENLHFRYFYGAFISRHVFLAILHLINVIMEGNSLPSGPVPLPRNINMTKTPVPLPRTVVNVPLEPTSQEMPTVDNGSSKSSKAPLLHPNTIRKSLRRVTSNVQEKSSAVLTSAKNVSSKMESSVRNILGKRHTVLGVEEPFEKEGDIDKQRCLSLPSDDIFRNISFGSPLSEAEDVSDCPSESSSPPCYPPPPLPDESIYDEIRSNQSVFSGNLFTSFPSPELSIASNSSYYEEILRSESANGASNSYASSGELEDSKSFNYYDIPFALVKQRGHSYENVAIDYLPTESSQNIYSEEPAKPKIFKKPIICPPSDEGSVCSSIILSNSNYENWQISASLRSISTKSKRSFATKSVIDEFDPLFEGRASKKEKEDKIKMHLDAKDVFHGINELQKSPTSPAMLDMHSSSSLVPNDSGEYFLYHRGAANQCLIGVEDIPKEIPVLTQGRKKSSLIRWSSMKRAIRMVADAAAPWSPVMSRKVQKAREEGQKSSTLLHNGYIFKSPSNGEKTKDLLKKWCQIADGKITLAVDKNGGNKEVIALDSILSIQTVLDVKLSSEGEPLICWELSTVGRIKPHLFGCPSPTDSKLWMRTILESLTNVFPAVLTVDYTRAGQCFLKEGVSSDWHGAWILLCNRTLYYCQIEEKSKEIDLRKARCIVLANDEGKCESTSESGSYIKIHSVEDNLYIQMDNDKETKNWHFIIKAAALRNGTSLEEQQLTKDFVPVIVDKCINFVYAHGIMSEGIYRRSGTNSKVTSLLSLLRKDAWEVQLSRKEYTEYDVSSVLKRFFRDLPEPLLTNTLHKYFCNAAGAKCTKVEKESMYKSFLDKLPQINYVTLRRLIGHLYFIHCQSDKNKMPEQNLAAIWAPTLMHVEGKEGIEWTKKECEVITDLILNYKSVFQVEDEEAKREKRILEVLEKVHESPNTLPIPKPSGDFKISIYIGSRRGEAITIPVGPGVDSGKICSLLAYKTDFAPHELCLSECVLGGVLSRPLHHSEMVLETVLKWAYWDSSDSKDNYLLLGNNTIYKEIIPLTKPPISKAGELRFADKKSKSFKTFIFEFSQAKLSYYKDKACAIKLSEWNIEEIIWYIGHEPKRNPQTRWAITFIDKKDPVKRTKECPYFGNTIAGSSKEEHLQWMAAMLVGQYHHSDLLINPLLM